jgi:ABC-type glycerol-3-phosphate transport system substrate-binding protein
MQEEYFPRQRESLPDFTARTGVEVAIDLLPVDPFWRDARTGFGEPPRWDLLVPDEVVVVEAMRRGLVEPLGERAKADGFDLADFLPAGLDTFRADNDVYGVPYVAMSNVLIYRHDLLARYALPVPTTWDDLRRVATAVQAALTRDGITDIVGFTSRGLAGYGHNFWIIGSTLFPSWGWRWNRGVNAPPLVHEPATVDALSFYAALLREAGPPNAATMTFTDTHARYASGKAVFLLDTATELATMRRLEPTGPGATSGLALVPVGPSGQPEPGLYSPAFCIPRSCRRKDEAWHLLAFLASAAELGKDAVDAGYAEPARNSVFSSPAYATAYDDEFRAVVSRSRELARVNRPMIPFGFELGEIVGAAAQAVIAGERDADTALRLAQTQIDAMRWAV